MAVVSEAQPAPAAEATVIVSRNTSGTNTTTYLTQDHLGSSSVVTNSTGGVLINSSFDAYGKRRGSNWAGNPSAGDWAAIAGTTRRGYTDHSMLDNVGLIHMNGRVHNPVLGRFMSADPYITDPLNTQNYNRYSYVYNNPLSFTDPSGFETDEVCQHRGSAGCMPEIVVECDAECQAAQRAQQTALEQLWGQANSSQHFQITEYAAMANDFLGNMVGVQTLDCLLFENCGNKSWGEAAFEAGLDRVPVAKLFTLGKNMVQAAKAARTVAKAVRPNGVPAGWVEQAAKKSGHTKFVNPANPHDYVRVKPDGTITQVRNGKAFDVNGNPVDLRSPDAHGITPETFVFRE